MATVTYPCYRLYKDTQGYWRWSYISSNYKTIGVSSEGYVNRSDCVASINLMKGSSGHPTFEF